MLFRTLDADAVLGIPQPSHAWLSGQLLRAWGNARFGVVRPREEACLGAEQHDIAWLEWEKTPGLDPETGRPMTFLRVPVELRLRHWSLGVERAMAYGRYVALLVSLHGTGIYSTIGAKGLGEEDLARVRVFLDQQKKVQAGLIASLASDPRHAGTADLATIERNRLLVRTVDLMSLAICGGVRERVTIPGVPTAGEPVDLTLNIVDGDLARITVDPWPFAAETVEVVAEGIVMRFRAKDQDELHPRARHGGAADDHGAADARLRRRPSDCGRIGGKQGSAESSGDRRGDAR